MKRIVTQMRRTLSLVLAFMMVVTAVPQSVNTVYGADFDVSDEMNIIVDSENTDDTAYVQDEIEEQVHLDKEAEFGIGVTIPEPYSEDGKEPVGAEKNTLKPDAIPCTNDAGEAFFVKVDKSTINGDGNVFINIPKYLNNNRMFKDELTETINTFASSVSFQIRYKNTSGQWQTEKVSGDVAFMGAQTPHHL